MSEATTLVAAPEIKPTEPVAEAAAPEPASKAEDTTPASAPTSTPAVATDDTKEDDEPQNALTKKFTDEEWKALKEFRVSAFDDLVFPPKQ